MTRVIIGDFRTGRNIRDLPVSTLSWETSRNKAETITATVDLLDPDIQALGLRSAATPGKAFLAVIENDLFMAAGPIWQHDYDRDKGELTLTAAGMASYWDHRLLLPNIGTNANPLGADTTLSGWDLGTIAKKLVVQAWQWTGGQVPITVDPDRTGTDTRTYLGADLNIVGTELGQLSQVENGPDMEFRAYWTTDRMGVLWAFRTGSADAPRLRSQSVHHWDYSVPQPSIANLQVKVDSSQMTGHAYATGGRTGDQVLISWAWNTTLTDEGYPLLETADASHSSVVVADTLTGYATEAIRNGTAPNEFWTFKVRAQEAPRVGEYWLGDSAQILVRGDPFIADGIYQCAISSLSGDQDGEWVAVKGGQVTMIADLSGTTRHEYGPVPPLYPAATLFPAPDLFPGGS